MLADAGTLLLRRRAFLARNRLGEARADFAEVRRLHPSPIMPEVPSTKAGSGSKSTAPASDRTTQAPVEPAAPTECFQEIVDGPRRLSPLIVCEESRTSTARPYDA